MRQLAKPLGGNVSFRLSYPPSGLIRWSRLGADTVGRRTIGRRHRIALGDGVIVDTKADDEDDRTTAVGLYHYAVSYHEAARALTKANTNTTHPDSPIYFLNYHAIELFLKAYLRLAQISVAQLAGSKFGHKVERLGHRAVEAGLVLLDEDVEVLRLMEHTDIVIRARYIRTGYFSMPTLGVVDRTCQSLRGSVAEAIRKSGTFVRA